MPRLMHALAFAVAGTVAPGCYSSGSGRSPPLARIYFPVGLELSAPDTTGSPRFLYVANSDFDLQFNAGTLQVYDLNSLRAEVPPLWSSAMAGGGDPAAHVAEVCASRRLSPQSFSDSLLYPGPCTSLDTTSQPPAGQGPYLADSVSIGAFATDIVRGANPSGGARLFLPVRGDAALDWIDVDEDAPEGQMLDCGQSADDRRCDDAHRVGSQRANDANGVDPVVTPPDPFGIAIDDAGEAILTAHQSTGQVSLFVNDWKEGPSLQSVLGNLPFGAIDLATVPVPAIAAPLPASTPRCAKRGFPYQPGFLLTFVDAAQVELVRYFDACAANPNPAGLSLSPTPVPPFLEASGATAIGTNASGVDSRGLAIDATRRRACEALCTAAVPPDGHPERSPCLTRCAAVSLDVYLANRTPSSLIVGRTVPVVPAPDEGAQATTIGAPSGDLPAFFDSAALSDGPTRVVIGNIIDQSGKLARRVFVVCFDSRVIFVFDPSTSPPTYETIIRTGRGPQALAIDSFVPAGTSGEAHAFGYVAHFTDSYVGVVDLDQRHSTYGQILLTVGQPVAPRASQ